MASQKSDSETERPLGWPDGADEAELFRQFADNLPTLAWIANADGYISWYNRRWHEYCGTTPEEMEGWGWQKVHDPRKLPEVLERWQASIASGQPFEMTFPLRGADGTFRPFLTRIVPWRDEEGRILRWFGTNTDISGRTAAQEQVRESEARLRALTDNLPGGAVYQLSTGKSGKERRFLFLSQSYQRLTGVPAEVVLADPSIAYEMTLPEDLAMMAEAEAEAIANRALFDVETRFRRADGQMRWCRIISAPREQEDGSLIWDGLEIDVTEQKEALAAARESERRLSSALMAAQLGTFEWNLATDEVRLDARSREIFGFAPEEGGRVEELFERVHPEDFPRVRREARRAGQSAARLEIEYRIRLPDGSVRSLVGISDVAAGTDGEPERVFGVFRDITDRKRLEEDLRSLNETLERRVEERTAELLQAQEALRQSQKLEAMGQLTGGVAHDFNNLLSPIIGGIDLLQRSGLGGEREHRLLDGAMQSAERARTLVQRLLAFARRQPLQATSIDVDRLVAGMAGLVASTSGPQVRVVVDVPQGLSPAKADANQLELAILNLSVNARDAMPDGGTLTITAEERRVDHGASPKLLPGNYIRLSVSDTGIGMDEETLSRAVEPFFSTKGIGKGTGLGLSMAHGLASQLGGALLMSSKPGLGTCVELWLPVSGVAPKCDRSVRSPSETAAGAGSVLLVDDEALVRTSTADMLRDLGFEVTEAESGKEALSLLGERRFELIVTDHLMPGITGTELAQIVRVDWPETIVLLISGYADLEAVSPDLPRLSKPFRQADLAAAIASAKEKAPVPS